MFSWLKSITLSKNTGKYKNIIIIIFAVRLGTSKLQKNHIIKK